MSSINPCPHCGQQVSIPQQYWGTMVRCPMCGGTFQAGAVAWPVRLAPPVEPHRGGLILTLAILGLLICGPLALAAWLMAVSDLQKIRHGTMDRSGYGLTQAGLVVGIIGTILWVFWLFILIADNT